MNRSRYVPFERNRYFYGKLLTVRDFISEQTYLSDKRRLTNRLLFGNGVISGLQVVAVDDKSVSIETGAALDQLGREIVVPSPVTLKLSNIDGFKNNDFAKNLYLCIAYDEKGKEAVHAVAGSLGRDEEVSEYNRILESYRLFLTEQPLSPAMQEYDHLIEDTSIWYDDGLVRILQSVPRYVEPGQCFDVCITIEKTLQTPHIEFEYEPECFGVDVVDELINGKIVFSEPTDGEQTTYTKLIRMRAGTVPSGMPKQFGSVEAKSGSLRLVVGDKLINEVSYMKQVIEISEESAEKRILDAYYSRSLDRAMESPAEPCVYLAKINLLQMGATYVIDRVESLPFQQYVVNPTMLYKLLSLQERTPVQVEKDSSHEVATQEKMTEFPDIKDEFKALLGEDENAPQEQYVSTGLTEISIVPLQKKKWYQRRKKDFYSEEIEHGLDKGHVFITAGLSDVQEETDIVMPEMWNRSNAIYSGQQDIFNGSEYALDHPNVSIGIIHYPKKGTFRIGVRIHQKTERTKVTIRWWAMKPMLDTMKANESNEVMKQMEQGMAEASTSTT